MKIDILANDGSPLGISCKDIYGTEKRVGVGGAELAILTLCEAWHKRGDDVTFYNNPSPDWFSPFKQEPIGHFNPAADRDVLIIFRSPNYSAVGAKGKKVWFSCDQYTVGNFGAWSPLVDEVVVISPFHARYFAETYGIRNAHVIDIPVRDELLRTDIEKDPYKLIFTSVPDRGLHRLREPWIRIKNEVPQASLTITSDYRLWGTETAMDHRHRAEWLETRKGVSYVGALRREEYVRELLSSRMLVYPCVYDELFCISCAEAQVAGAYPVTSSVGALETTNMGGLLLGNGNSTAWLFQFTETVIDLLHHQEKLAQLANETRQKAMERFSIERILSEWDKVFA